MPTRLSAPSIQAGSDTEHAPLEGLHGPQSVGRFTKSWRDRKTVTVMYARYDPKVKRLFKGQCGKMGNDTSAAAVSPKSLPTCLVVKILFLK